MRVVDDLAALHALSAYDAACLELALRRNLPLATLDDALGHDRHWRGACRTAGGTRLGNVQHGCRPAISAAVATKPCWMQPNRNVRWP